MEIINQISQHLQHGDDQKVAELTKKALEQHKSAKDILDNGLIAGMNVIGDQFKAHEIFLPDVLLAAKAMYAGMDQLRPLLIKEGISSRGKVVIGTVQGDLHDIGKNLVGIMLKGAGFEVFDLGNDVAPEKFVESARINNASVIGMSALLTTTMAKMKQVIDILKKENLLKKIKTIIGGAPVSKAFADEIGADEYGYDAGHAVECIKAMVGENQNGIDS
jgi:5-methyltetrahydrofolate--homocysteine methyltransferase